MASSGGGTNPDGTKKARIEVIPLIDVIFFLLATFVLFTLSLNKSEGVSVSLPEVVYSQEGKEAQFLINGDQAAYFSQARYVFDEVRKTGFQKVKIETRVIQD